MPERKFDAGSKYRYGFNGKENDNEVKGEGNQQDYGMRIYDARIGRFLSVDPISHIYPELTVYQFASNRPIDGIDLDGLEYLSANQSKISMNIKLVESDGEIALSSDVFVSKYKNISDATINFLKVGGSGHIATIQTLNYKDIVIELHEKVATAFARPEMQDIVDMPKSITQKEIYIQKQIKTSRIIRKTNPDASTVKVPTSVNKGSTKGNRLQALIEYGSRALLAYQENIVKNDFARAKDQLFAVKEVLNDIQIGLSNNVFKEEADKENLYDYANYLLDGTKPMKMITVGHTDAGTEIRKEIEDFQKLNKFKKYSKKISEAKFGKSKLN